MPEDQQENTTKETPEQHLLRSVCVTSAARFHAAKRLRAHETWSLWSISLVSLFSLVLSLLEPFKVTILLPDNIIQLSQTVASVVILMVSFFVNGNKYGERSEKMHACALELNAISREIETELFQQNTDTIPKLRKRYEGILAKHENHSDIDFSDAIIRKAAAHYNIKSIDKLWMKIRYYAEFIPYAILILVAVSVLFISIYPIQCRQPAYPAQPGQINQMQDG
jgi:hypothetical protein